jgi:DNA-binding NarL/FixJ family response regulator
MDRLIFIDDDADELEIMRDLIGNAYDYLGLHWPEQLPDRSTIHEPEPAIFVSDLYVPPSNHRDAAADFPDEVLARHAELARKTAEAFRDLYPGPRDAKKRMRQSMAALVQGRNLLDEQWRGLGQSPEHGLGIFHLVRREYPDVPFIFYSRKITPDDVINVLDAGASDAIQKRDWKDRREFLDRLRWARQRREP